MVRNLIQDSFPVRIFPPLLYLPRFSDKCFLLYSEYLTVPKETQSIFEINSRGKDNS